MTTDTSKLQGALDSGRKFFYRRTYTENPLWGSDEIQVARKSHGILLKHNGYHRAETTEEALNIFRQLEAEITMAPSREQLSYY